MSKTILIGPSGFLGYSFLKKNKDMIAVGRNKPLIIENDFFQIKDDNDFDKLEFLDFDNVIFLIGNSHHKILNSSSVLALEKNVLPLAKFLFFLKEKDIQVKKIITFTTMLQYDSDAMVLPCKENSKRNPYTNNYVFSKYVAEMLSEKFREEFSIIDIRVSNVFGPFYLSRPDLIPSLIEKIIKKEELSVWNKSPRRDFIYVDDVVDAVMKLIETDFSGPVNLGSGVANSVEDICNILQEIASSGHIKDLKHEATGHQEYYHDISLLRKLINWSPSYSLKDGIHKTYSEMLYFDKELGLY